MPSKLVPAVCIFYVHDIPIQGRFESKDYALFQCQPAKGYTESLNKQDLIDELRLLGQAQYFLNTFYARAEAFGVAKLPGMYLVVIVVVSCFQLLMTAS